MPLYSLGEVSPEAIYNYGDKIPKLTTSEGFVLPSEKEFNLLTGKEKPQDIEALSKMYHVVFITTYDLNTAKKGSRAHRSRLVNQLYRMSRKE